MRFEHSQAIHRYLSRFQLVGIYYMMQHNYIVIKKRILIAEGIGRNIGEDRQHHCLRSYVALLKDAYSISAVL